MGHPNHAIKGEKCAPHPTTGGTGSICEILWERLRDVREARGHGLYLANFVSMETGEASRSAVLYKMGAKDGGLIINLCPWCQGRLYDYDKFMEAS